jgi:hypothetical protein
MPIDRPRTVDEIAALPIGPAFGQVTMVVNGKTLKAPVMEPVDLFWSDDDDVLGYTDSDGAAWMLGRYANGEWFKRRCL